MSSKLLKQRFSSEIDEETTFKAIHFVSFLLVFLSILFFITYDTFQEGVLRQYNFMLTDWQLTFAVLSILAISIGWKVLQGVSLIIDKLHKDITKGTESAILNYTRIIIVLAFTSLLVSNWIFEYPFDDILLYLISGLIFLSLGLLAWGLHKCIKWLKGSKEEQIKKSYLKQLTETPDEPREFFYPQVWVVFLLCFLLFIFVLILSNILFGIADPFGISNGILGFFSFIRSNILLSVMFLFILLLTVFWKFVQIIFVISPKLAQKVIDHNIERRINRFRITLLVFICLLILFKNLPFMWEYIDVDPITQQVIQIALSVLITALSLYLVRKRFL